MQVLSKYRCIFCESAQKLSREHIYADWLKDYIEKTESHTFHLTTFMGGAPVRGKLYRPGDAHSQRLRVVCSSCNNGWMSRLQEKAKPLLVPLIKDEWPVLNKDTQATIASWIVMTTMVVEFANPETAAIPQKQRTHFMANQKTPPDWSIWIGRQDPEGQHPAYFNHFGRRLLSGLPHHLTAHHIQMTTFTIGRFFFKSVTITPPIKGKNINHDAFSRGYDIRTIEPFIGDIDGRPITAHDRKSRQIVANDGAHELGFRNIQIFPS